MKQDISGGVDKGYKLIPLDEIHDEAREIAVRWSKNMKDNFISQKHKLASDIMNYAHKYHLEKINTSEKLKSLFQPTPIDSKEGAEEEEDDIYDSIYMKVVEIVEKDNIQGEMYNETANKLKEMFDIKYAPPKQ